MGRSDDAGFARGPALPGRFPLAVIWLHFTGRADFLHRRRPQIEAWTLRWSVVIALLFSLSAGFMLSNLRVAALPFAPRWVPVATMAGQTARFFVLYLFACLISRYGAGNGVAWLMALDLGASLAADALRFFGAGAAQPEDRFIHALLGVVLFGLLGAAAVALLRAERVWPAPAGVRTVRRSVSRCRVWAWRESPSAGSCNVSC